MDKEGVLLLCSHLPCFTGVGAESPDYQVQTDPRLVIVVAQHLNNNLLVVPLTSSPAPFRIPVLVATAATVWREDTAYLIGDQDALSQVSYADLAQLTTVQWGSRVAGDYRVKLPEANKRAKLHPAELAKLRSMIATQILGLPIVGSGVGLSGYGGQLGILDGRFGGGLGGGLSGGLGAGLGGSEEPVIPAATEEEHRRALLAHDEDPFTLMSFNIDVPCATPEEMASIIYADPYPSRLVPVLSTATTTQPQPSPTI